MHRLQSVEIEELRGLEFHNKMKTTESIEEIGLELQTLASNAFSSTPAREFDRMQDRFLQALHVRRQRKLGAPKPSRVLRSSMTEPVFWNSTKSSMLLQLLPEERPGIQSMARNTSHSVRLLALLWSVGVLLMKTRRTMLATSKFHLMREFARSSNDQVISLSFVHNRQTSGIWWTRAVHIFPWLRHFDFDVWTQPSCSW